MLKASLLLLLLAAHAIAQTVYITPNATSACSTIVGTCAKFTYNTSTNTIETGPVANFNVLYSTSITFTIEVPLGTYLNMSFYIQTYSLTLAISDSLSFIDGATSVAILGASKVKTSYNWANFNWQAGVHTITLKNSGTYLYPNDKISLTNVTFALNNLSCQDVPVGSASICSGKGTCIPNNPLDGNGTCLCNTYYYGSNCTIPTTCNNIVFNNVSVCSGQGICDYKKYNNATGNCVCNNQHFGLACETPLTCSGVEYNDPSICSGRGYCYKTTGSTPNLGYCTCNNPYYSTTCNGTAYCGGVIGTDPSTCTGHGTCYPDALGNGYCSCTYPYTSTLCDKQYQCNGINITDPTACSQKGTCKLSGTTPYCLCSFPTYGSNCDTTPSFTNMRTYCTDVSSYKCSLWRNMGSYFDSGDAGTNTYSSLEYNFTTPFVNTSLYFEYKISAWSPNYLRYYLDDKLISSWSGVYPGSPPFTTFASLNISTGFHRATWVYDKGASASLGDDKSFIRNITLSYPITCNGISAADKTVCSGHGTCVADSTGNGQCTCSQYYYSSDCSQPITCGGVPFSDSNVCNGRGMCGPVDGSTTGKCSCNSPYSGNLCQDTPTPATTTSSPSTIIVTPTPKPTVNGGIQQHLSTTMIILIVIAILSL
jgi:hypothetical protein